MTPEVVSGTRLPSGGHSAGTLAATVITCGVVSTFSVTGTEAVRPTPFIAEHVKVTPAVSAASVIGPQPDEEARPDSGSLTSQVTETVLTYHPLLPSVPTTCGMMTGGVVSPATVVDASATIFEGSILPTRSRA